MTKNEVMKKLKSLSCTEDVEMQKHFGITAKKQLGIRTPVLRKLAKEIRINHSLALELWDTEILEARILAAFIADHKQISEKEMEKWLKDFDNWAICDGVCSAVFDKTPIAYEKAMEWAERKHEFEKRAGFVMMAVLAVHDKKSEDEKFLPFFELIKKHSDDDRNFVKKAVNWALRQIGKRNAFLYEEALLVAEEISELESKSAKWIAADALREFRSENVNVRRKKEFRSQKSESRIQKIKLIPLFLMASEF